MTVDRDPIHLLEELKWLSGRENLLNEWNVRGDDPDNYSPGELYNILFDDLLIDEADRVYSLDENQLYYIKNIANFLNRALPNNTEMDVKKLVSNPNFLIAQKTCGLL